LKSFSARPASSNIVRFGRYELDLIAGELYAERQRIPLQEQPLQLLRMLVGRPGEVLSRDDIRRQLWPNGTMVEFDDSINTAIKKLRLALGDSAEEPRYVETVARRGYRLMVPVFRAERTDPRPLREVPIGQERDLHPANQTGTEASHDSVLEILRRRRLSIAWVVTALLAVGLVSISIVHFREKPPPMTPLHLQAPTPEGLLPILSPDGRKAAFIMAGRLWIQFLGSGESHDLTPAENADPFWSPDGRFIGYLFERKLKKIQATGGPPQTVTDLRGDFLAGGGAWNRDDVIVFGDRPIGLFRVPASGGSPLQITALNSARHENSQYCPSFLPDGRHFVYMRASTDEWKSALYLGSVDAKPQQQSSTPLLLANSQPVYTPSADPAVGYLLFVREGSLLAQPFDNRRMEPIGQPATVVEDLSFPFAGTSSEPFSASANDTLVFGRRARATRRLTWYDQEAKLLGTAGEPAPYLTLALSPDGTRLAFGMHNSGVDRLSILVMDLSRNGESTRFAIGSPKDTHPVWSPDGSHIIFRSNRDGPYDLYQKRADGAKDEEVLLKSNEDKYPTSWSRDGRFLLYTTVNPKTKADIWLLPLEGRQKPLPFLITEFNERQARFSPDGRWVAYTSDESGQDEIYVRSFSMKSDGTALETGGRWHVSIGSGAEPHWRGDGRELYYRSLLDGKLMAVEIATKPTFLAGLPRPLGVPVPFKKPWPDSDAGWDSAPDGKRFLVITNSPTKPQQFTVILNWQAGLKK
jgi:eukaryotic-like serine/threonine-protein kinase